MSVARWAGATLLAACAGSEIDSGRLVDASTAATASPRAPSTSLDEVKVVPEIFPMHIGDRWEWEIGRSRGAGLRVFGIASEPATAEVAARITAEVIASGAGGRFTLRQTWTSVAEGQDPSEKSLVVWNENGQLWMDTPEGPQVALAVEAPPDPLATESVPCKAFFLGGISAMCSPAPGGPLAVPPGPSFAVVSADPNSGWKALGQVFVGLATAGVVIPGNRSVTETLRLTSWTPARPTPKSARVEAWRAQPDLSRLEAVLAGADREEAAAILALAEPNHHSEMASRVLLAANAADRPALARVAVGLEPGDRLRLLARLSPLPPMSEAQLQALVNHIAAEDRPAAQRVVRGDWPVYREVLLASDDAGRAAACAGKTLETEELGAIIRRFSTPGSAVERLAAGVPEERRAALVLIASEALTFDSERLELLSGRFAWFAVASDDTLLALWKSFGFDAERAEAVGQTVRVLPPARRADALVLGVESMAFDDGRTALLDALPEVVATLTAAQKQRVVAAYVFEAEEARTRLGLRR